jgi:lactate racemase
MNFNIKYGSGIIKLNLNNGYYSGTINSKRIKKSNQSESSLIKSAIFSKLNKFIESEDLVGVIVPDNTRKAGVKIYLPVILDLLKSKGVLNKNIIIFIASGSHKLMNHLQLKELIGKDVINKFRIIQNDAYDESQFIYKGKTKRCSDIFINKDILKVDKLIATSSVLYHYFAGFGGGPKILMPGMVSCKTIIQNHKRSLLKDGSFNPKCRNGNIIDNPVYSDIKDAVNFFPDTLYLATVLNEEGNIIKVFSGEIIDTHKKATSEIDKIFKVKIREKADVVICSAGGKPKDINLIQSHKSIHNAYSAVKTGGTIIFFGECIDGIGSKAFLDYFLIESFNDLKKEVISNYSLNAQTALSFRSKLNNCKIIIVSDKLSGILKKVKIPNLFIQKFSSETVKLVNNFIHDKTFYFIPSANSLNIV